MSNKSIFRTKMGCVISPYRPGQDKALERNVSLYDEVYHKSIPYAGFKGNYHGIPSFITYHNRNINGSRYDDYDIYEQGIIIPKSINGNIDISDIILKDSQTYILDRMNFNVSKGDSWYINLQTAEGKTVLSIYISGLLKLKSMILCYSKDILNNWKNSFIDKGKVDPDRILQLDSSTLTKLQKGKLKYEDYDIILSTTSFFNSKIKQANDYSIVSDIINSFGIGILYFDEAHRHLSSMIKITAIANVKYNIFLSAEFHQSGYDKNRMFKEYFFKANLIKLDDELAKSLKYTKLLVVKFDSKPDMFEKESIYNRYGYSDDNYIRYQISKGTLTDAIIYCTSEVLRTDPNHRILIVVPTVNECNIIYDKLSTFKDSNPLLNIGLYHGKVDDSTKEHVKDKSDIIVATYDSFGTGLDTENIKYVFSTGQCNETADNQAAGRSRPLKDGSSAIYFMFVDTAFQYCKKKLNKRLRYLMQTKSKEERPNEFRFN